MSDAPQILDGVLTDGQSKIVVRARFASRYSLWVQGNGHAGRAMGDISLNVGGEAVDIGPCRALSDSDTGDGGPWIRYVPTERMHDFEKLFFHTKTQTLERAALELPLILGYKNRIDAVFRAFVSDLTYDLNVYSRLFDQMDAEYREESPEVAQSIQASLIETTGKPLYDYMAAQLRELERIVADFTESEHEHHGFYFRRQMWNILLRAPVMARTNLKPRGYNGDSEMMRMVYLNEHQGDSTFGRILHKFSVDQPGAQAVRNRRNDVAHLVREFSGNRGGDDERLRILSVACGPSFELREIVRTARDAARMHFSLFDQDQQALMEAGTFVTDLETRIGAGISADFIRESVRTMLVSRVLQERWGRFDFIYSMGLFDYLTFPVAHAVLKKLYQLLTDGGEMVVGNFHVSNASRVFMEYWLDWKLIYRTEEEFRRMADGLENAHTSLQVDETGIQMLLRVHKGGADVR